MRRQIPKARPRRAAPHRTTQPLRPRAAVFTVVVPSLLSSKPTALYAQGPYRLIEAQVTPGDIHFAATALREPWFQMVLGSAHDVSRACIAKDVQVVRPERKTFKDAAASCGIEVGQNRDILLWDKSRLGGQVPNWQDFWNIAQHPGKRALPFSARVTLESALLADGVAPHDVYKVLRTADGANRAFRKLTQIKPYVSWWRSARDAEAIVKSGGALMALIPAQAALHLNINSAGSRYRFSRVDDFGEIYDVAVLRRGDEAQRNAAVWALRNTPLQMTASQSLHLANKPKLMINDTFWLRHGARLEQRFAEWIHTR